MRINKEYKNILIAILVYLLIGIIYTYPVIFDFSGKIFAQAGDPFGTISRFWQFSEGIKKVSYFFPDQPLYRMYTYILNMIFSEISTFNILSLFSFVFSAIPFYLIVKKITKNSYAAFFGGLIIAICPYRVAQLMQHLNLANIGFLGFYTYFLLKLSERFSVKNMLFTSLFFILTLFDCYTYGIFSLVILIVFVLVKIIAELRNKDRTILSKNEIYASVGSILTILVLISSFILIPIYSQENSQVEEVKRSKEELTTYSAYGGYYFLPSPQSLFFSNNTKDYFDEKIDSLGTNYTEQTLYVGYIVLILSLFWIVYFMINYKKISNLKRFTTYFFLLIGISGAYLSFSYPINIGNVNISVAEKIYNLIPFLRVYSRFGLLVIISLAVFASMSIAVILNMIKNDWLKMLLLVFIIALVSIEYVIWPKDRIQAVSANDLPQVYKYLEDQDKCKLVEYPFFSEEAPQGYEYLIWRMYYDCELVNETYTNLRESKLFREEVRDINSLSDIETLKENGVSYIIINKDLFLDTKEFWLSTETINNTIPYLNSYEDLDKIGEWDDKVLYKIR